MNLSKLEHRFLSIAYGVCLLAILGLMLSSAILLWTEQDFNGHWALWVRIGVSCGILSFSSALAMGAIEFRGRTRQSNHDS